MPKPSLPFPVVPRKGEETEEEGGSELRRLKKGSRNESLVVIMEERASLGVSDSRTKGCYLHDPRLTLDSVLLREGDDDCFFPFSLCASFHLSFIPNSL